MIDPFFCVLSVVFIGYGLITGVRRDIRPGQHRAARIPRQRPRTQKASKL